MDAQLKKGVLPLCILHYISKKESYGYEIIKDITELFPGIAEASIYSILRRLLASGYLSVACKEMLNVPTRKYYKLSPQGKIYLQELTEQWKIIAQSIKKVGIC